MAPVTETKVGARQRSTTNYMGPKTRQIHLEAMNISLECKGQTYITELPDRGKQIFLTYMYSVNNMEKYQ